MDHKIEKLFRIANTKKNQYLTIAIIFLLHMNISLMLTSLPFIEKNPEVSYTDSTGKTVEATLTYEICKAKDLKEINKYGFSWTSEFEITCDNFQTSLIGNFAFIGAFVGSLMFSYIANRIGRRFTILICTSLYSIFIFLCQFIYNFYILGILLMFGNAVYIMFSLGSFIYLTEILEERLRSKSSPMINIGYCLNGFIYIYIFKALDNWRLTYLISGSIVLVLASLFYILTVESPKYYLSKGQIPEFIEAIKTLAKKNKRIETLESELNNPKSELFKDDIVYQLIQEFTDSSETTSSSKRITTLSLIKYPSVRKLFFILCIFWLTGSGSYYGNNISLKLLPGDFFINVMINYISELISYTVSGLLINISFMGRKRTLHLNYTIVVISSSILFFFVMPDLLVLILAFLCRFSISSIFNIIFTYTLELYPTVVRSEGFSLNSAVANAVNMLLPLVIEYTTGCLTMIMACLNMVCFILLYFLPETLNNKGQENITELNEVILQTSKDYSERTFSD
jgi:putative MFS transporter